MKHSKITISKVSSNTRDTYISIVLSTALHKPLFQVEITPEDFALCITGQGMMPCKYKNIERKYEPAN